MAYTVGICQDMCPALERRVREKARLLHPFEVVEDTKNGWPQADVDKTIKEYHRPAAGTDPPKPEDIRPIECLRRTMDYMITKVLTRTDVPFSMIYDYVFDRIRAVRQDIVIQQCLGGESIRILEQAVRFYVYAGYRLRNEPVSIFDPHLNRVHVQECLKKLLTWYPKFSYRGNYTEMITLYVLLNLGSTEALQSALSLPRVYRTRKPVKKAFEISVSWIDRNYVRVLRLAFQLPFLSYCAVFEHLPSVRRHAIMVMDTAYSSKNLKFDKSHLTLVLKLKNDNEAEKLCQHYGIATGDTFVSFCKGQFMNESQLFDFRRDPIALSESEISSIILGDDHSENHH